MEPLIMRAKDKETGVALNVYADDVGMESPRDWGTLGTMVCFHRDYNLGDEHKYDTPRDFLENLAAEVATRDDIVSVSNKIAGEEKDYESEEEYCDMVDDLEDNLWSERAEDEDLWEIITDHAVILPLYLYDHSGITMKTKPFGCPWDSGQVGWIYVTHETVAREFSSDHTVDDWERAEYALKQEIETYDQYITGEVYGFVLEKEDVCNRCGQETSDMLDSLWGLYGYEDLEENLREHLEEKYHYLVDKLKVI